MTVVGFANTRNLAITLFTKTQHEQLLANCQAQIIRMDNRQPDIDFKPVVKLFTPDAQCTWLVSELGLDDWGSRRPLLWMTSTMTSRSLPSIYARASSRHANRAELRLIAHYSETHETRLRMPQVIVGV